MLREAHYFIIVLMFILLVTTLLTFFLSYSILPPQEDEIPRRSRPVISIVINKLKTVEQDEEPNIKI